MVSPANLFGNHGGLIMFVVLKDEDRRMAKKGLVVGVVLTAIGAAIPLIGFGVFTLTLG